MSATTSPEAMLMDLAADCRHDPLGFAKGFWPDRQLRAWQHEILSYLTERLSNPSTRHKLIRIAVASGNGIGKSALIGMILTWAMSTCAGCRCKVTAGKGEQLDTKTVPEVTSWFKGSLAGHWFDCHAKSIKSLQTDKPEKWRVDFETWTEEKPDTFQGLHNQDKRIVMVFDEGSAIANVIYDAAETSFTDDNAELIFLVFGNPLYNAGRFRELFGAHKHLWRTYQIDSRTVEGVKREQADEWVALYGEDSDFVRVKVRGEFPRAGSSQFIPSDAVAACRKYRAEGYEALPKILSVDVARFGDDRTIIGYRQGRKSAILGKYRGKDTVWVAEETIRLMGLEQPDATVIDGDGLGAGVVDHIKFRGFGQRLFEFHGGASANDGSAYFNRRAEVWGAMREWLIANAEIPNDPEVDTDLTGIEYGFGGKGGQIQLERKEDMKKRGLSSPDIGDMLAMTFAINVMPKRKDDPPPMYYPGEQDNSWMS
jgi:hypothetical protein